MDPDTLSLLSILNFRRTKFDFTYDKQTEHSMIFKFVSWVAESTTNKKWENATSVLRNGLLKASIYFILSLIFECKG